MRAYLQLAARAYALLLGLYPRALRAEFGDEMEVVFSEALAEAATSGNTELAAFVWRELRQAPISIIREHWRERRGTTMQTPEAGVVERASWLGMLAALVPFLFIGLLQFPGYLSPMFVYITFGLVLLIILVGLVRGAPIWSLPIAGFLASILSLMALGLPIILLQFVPGIAQWYQEFATWTKPFPMLGLLTIIVLVLAALLKPFRPFYARLRADWTLLAFALYGSSAFWLGLTYDEYVGEQPYVLAASVMLIGGLLVYLRSRSTSVRFGVLATSLVLTLAIVSASKWILVPSQTWPFDITEALRVGETQSTIINGLGMLFTVLGLPVLYHSLDVLLARPRTSLSG